MSNLIDKLNHYIESENADADLYFDEFPPEQFKATLLKLGAETKRRKELEATLNENKAGAITAARCRREERAMSELIDAAEWAYSEIAFAVHDLAGRRLNSEEAIDRRSERLAKAADRLRAALDRASEVQ